MGSVSVYYWKPTYGAPVIRPGNLSADPGLQTLDLPSKARSTGGEITFPTGGFNRLEISYFQTTDSGALRVNSPRSIEGETIEAGELVREEYKLRNIRVSWNYLTFPVPPLDSRFRVKTFWEAQYTHMLPTLSFPERELSETQVPRVIETDKSLFLPGAGIGFEYVPSRSFRIEGRASGMALPGRSRYLDSQLSAVVRWGVLELLGGVKSYHFRTSLKQELVYKGTVTGPFFGLRYVFPRQ